jgi:hypothetical protein
MSSAQDKGGNSKKEGQLKKWQETEFGVPKNGIWFFDVLSMLADAPEGAFVVAWDKPQKAKCFGYYESPTECYKALSNNVLKCCYEVFMRGSKYSEYSARSPTLAYGDLEYYGDQDTDHLCARENLRRLHSVCETKLGFTPEVYLLCGTRLEKPGVFKNSYHYIIANLYGETCDDVKQIFLPETLRTGVDDDLKEFDQVVYSTCQQLRMPLCSKRGSDVPLRRINKNLKDPEDPLTAKYEDDDLAAILPSLVTVFDKTKPTMHLLKPWTLVPEPVSKPLPSAGTKRTAEHTSLDTPGRDLRQRFGDPLEKPSDVADLLVAMHPDQIGHGYESFRDVVFGVTNAAGNSPEVVKILKEWTRIREKADHRDKEWPRIEAGNFASAGGGGIATIGMGSLVFNQQQYPAACTSNRESNADPLPNCRALLALEDVLLFELFEKFLRHVNYRETSFKWLVQIASYVVPNLKDQVYDTIQGGYEDITKKDFDLVWDGGQPSQIYEFAFKRYLADIVEQINSRTPLVETTADEPDGEATADDSSYPQEGVATVGHVRTSKEKARGRQSTALTKEEVLTLIVKMSPIVHSLEASETLHKAVRGALKGQKNVDKTTEHLLGLSALLQGKSSKTGTASCLHVNSTLEPPPPLKI